MDRNDKAQQIAELQDKLQKSAAVVICDFRGLQVPAVTALREDFRKQQCEYKVYKNTLVKLAIAGTPMEKMGKYLEGPSAVIFSWDSPSAAAKVAHRLGRHAGQSRDQGIAACDLHGSSNQRRTHAQRGCAELCIRPRRTEACARSTGLTPRRNYNEQRKHGPNC